MALTPNPEPHTAASARMGTRAPWVMLLALTGGFSLSQAFRTVAAIMAPQLQSDFNLSAQALGIFAGSFHFAFGTMQLFAGVGIDLHGVRRTVLAVFPLAIAGSVLSALAPNYGVLVFAQVLIGLGCAPSFLVSTVFIARHFPSERFAVVSGLVLCLGGVGMLVTGTPLAWLIEASSWRAGYWVLTGFAVLAWLAILWLVHEPGQASERRSGESVLGAVRGFGALFTLPHTLGIVALSAVTYASFISLRGLWLGPMLIERHGFSLVDSGNVAIAMSIASMIGAPLLGRLDPGVRTRRRWIIGFSLGMAALFALLAFNPGAAFDVVGAVVVGVASGFIVLQYADVRSAYSAALIGRAMALFTMAMFLGVALMQWLTGLVASVASAHGVDPFMTVLGAIAALLVAGTLAFALLPVPQRQAEIGH